MVIGQIEIRECRDGDIELERIDVVAEHSRIASALEHLAQRLDDRGIHLAHIRRFAQMAGAVEILAVEQRQELGMPEVVIPCELHEAADGRSHREVANGKGHAAHINRLVTSTATPRLRCNRWRYRRNSRTGCRVSTAASSSGDRAPMRLRGAPRRGPRPGTYSLL